MRPRMPASQNRNGISPDTAPMTPRMRAAMPSPLRAGRAPGIWAGAYGCWGCGDCGGCVNWDMAVPSGESRNGW